MSEWETTLPGAVQDAGAVLRDAGLTVLIGVVVVFSVLLVLTVIFKLFGMVTGGIAKKAVEPKPMPAVPPAVKPAPTGQPVVEAGIPEEVVAAITAAIAAMSPDGKQYAVRRIRRPAAGRSAWAAAGVSDNTRSF